MLWIDQCSGLHVHAFRTTHVLRYIFVHCIGRGVHCFVASMHCIRHGPVLQVYTFFTACMFLCAKVVTGYANAADCMAYS